VSNGRRIGVEWRRNAEMAGPPCFNASVGSPAMSHQRINRRKPSNVCRMASKSVENRRMCVEWRRNPSKTVECVSNGVENRRMCVEWRRNPSKTVECVPNDIDIRRKLSNVCQMAPKSVEHRQMYIYIYIYPNGVKIRRKLAQVCQLHMSPRFKIVNI